MRRTVTQPDEARRSVQESVNAGDVRVAQAAEALGLIERLVRCLLAFDKAECRIRRANRSAP